MLIFNNYTYYYPAMSPMALASLPVVDYSEIKLEKEIGMGNFSKVIR
jgi:hypothetical protein